MFPEDLRPLPLLEPPDFDPSDSVPSHRLLGQDPATPWVTYGYQSADGTELARADALPSGVTSEDVQVDALARLQRRKGGWEECFDLRDSLGGTMLSWEGDPYFGAERILDRAAMADAALRLRVPLLVAMIPSRNALFVRSLVRDGQASTDDADLSNLIAFLTPIHGRSNEPLSLLLFLVDARGDILGRAGAPPHAAT